MNANAERSFWILIGLITLPIWWIIAGAIMLVWGIKWAAATLWQIGFSVETTEDDVSEFSR